jgi:hypothetical protein
MKKLLIISCAAICVSSCVDSTSDDKKDEKTETTQTMLSDEEKKDGWQLLFDGNSTKGWHNYGGGEVGYAWKVADTTLHFDGSLKKDTIGQDIVTDDEFENFDLKLEWKIDTGGNSGIMFYVHEDSAHPKPYWTGPEMQVLDNERHDDRNFPKHRAGDLYDLISCSKETVKPALQWNAVEIKALNGKLDFWLNGENVVSTTMWDDNWNKMIAASKFRQWPGFGTFKKGRICLQDHGNSVWFRNIRIKKL